MVRFSIVDAVKEATQDEETAFRVFEIVRPRKAWELEEIENILKEGV